MRRTNETAVRALVDVRAERERRGMTREQLAAALGYSVTHIAAIERTPGLMTEAVALRLADVLALPLADLLGLCARPFQRGTLEKAVR